MYVHECTDCVHSVCSMNNLTDMDITPPDDPQDQTIDLTPLKNKDSDLTPLKDKDTDLTPPNDPQHHGDQGIDLTLPKNAWVPGDSPESPPPKSPLSPSTDPPPLNNLGKRYLTRSSGTAHPFSKKIKLGKSQRGERGVGIIHAGE